VSKSKTKENSVVLALRGWGHKDDDPAVVAAIAAVIRTGAFRELVEQGFDQSRAITLVVGPVPLRLSCPECGMLHLDEGEQATTPHRTHACQECGCLWAPAVVPTVGVRFLPGCRNKETPA
jgi:hypothetical protein